MAVLVIEDRRILTIIVEMEQSEEQEGVQERVMGGSLHGDVGEEGEYRL